MKILVNARFLRENNKEGIGLYSYEILKRMTAQRKDDQFVFCFDRPFDDKFVFSDNVLPIVVRPPARHAALFWWWYHVGIRKAFVKYQADMFFSPDGFTPTSRKVSKVLITIHDLAYKHLPYQISASNRWYYRQFMPRYIKKADRIITVSNSSKEDIITHFPDSHEKITTIYNGVRSSLVPLSTLQKDEIRSRITGGAPYFVSIGALHPRKNVARLIKAYSLFRTETRQRVKLIIIGRRAWYTEEIDQALARTPVRSDIQILDYIKDDQLIEILSAAQALCYVSLFEGFGLPIVEAMKAGVPVVTSDRSSMSEIAQNAACLIDPENIQSISKGLHEVLRVDYAADLIERGLLRAQDFNWDEAAQAHIKILDDLL